MNKLIIILIFVIFLIIYLVHYKRKQLKPSYDEKNIFNLSVYENKNRHIDKNKHSVGHFSKITTKQPSIFKYPLFYFSNPKEYILNKGDYLYIPKNWWHWVVSFSDKDNYSFSLNHWFAKTLNNNKPYIGKFIEENENKNILNLFENEIKKNNYKLKLWCDGYEQIEKETTLSNFIKNKNDYKHCYMLTLQAYDFVKDNVKNNNFFEEFKKNIPIPDIIKNEDIKNTNFWLNNGNIESGLHYDEHDGLLCVLSGKKIVTLFPPSDSKYLYPYQ